MAGFENTMRARDADDEQLEEALLELAEACVSPKSAAGIRDEHEVIQSAIDEVMHYYGMHGNESQERFDTLEKQIEHEMRPHGIMHRSVTLDDTWYKNATGAMLVRRVDDGSVTALLPALGGYYFRDHLDGRRKRVHTSNAHLFATEAISFYKPLPLRKLNARDLVSYIAHSLDAYDIFLIVLASVVVAALGMLVPRINNIIFSRVIISGSAGAAIGIGIFLVFAQFAAIVIGSIRSLLLSRMQTKIDVSVEAASMMRLLSLPASFFKQYSAGDISRRMDGLQNLTTILSETALTALFTAVFSLVYVIQIFEYTPALFIPAAVTIALTFIVTVLAAIAQSRLSLKQMRADARESGIGYAFINGIAKIKMAGAEKRAFSRWAKLYAKNVKYTYNGPLFTRISPVIITGIGMVGTVVIDFLATDTGVTVADFYAYNAAYGMVMSAFASLSQSIATLAQIKPVLQMVQPILEASPEVSESRPVISDLKGGIDIENVSFRYSDDAPLVLDGFSLHVEPGSYTAIVGKTGCGKSTLVRLLLGFERPSKGSIRYDGHDVRGVDLRSLRKHIGTVMQDTKLFAGTVFTNITISDPTRGEGDAWAAAEMAGLADDIRSMPMGMNTLISSKTGGISGGQRQRLAIARAILPRPAILLFDEATSALDNSTQKKVSDSLAQLECTRIVIAHRLSTIMDCDRIVMIDGGRIVEDGTYDELVAAGGPFAELVKHQRLDDAR